MDSKKVLIITYYWPPSGGVAVQRVLKFTKYLRDFNWEPIIYTVSNGEFPELDYFLVNEIPVGIKIFKTRIWEPYSIYKFFTGKKKGVGIHRNTIKSGKKISIAERISLWIRGNLFIPDTRCFWIKASVSFLQKKTKDEKFDAIISTGPPHSNHLIAFELSKISGIPWLADFRDPWTTMDYYQDLKLTQWADNLHHSMEQRVLKNASIVVVVGSRMKKEFDEKGAKRVEIIPNGFDESDFNDPENVRLDSEFTIVHVGSFLKRRNPEALWKTLANLKQQNHPLMQSLRIKLIGRIDSSIIESINHHELGEYLLQIPFIPHNEVVRNLKSAQILLLPIDDFDGAKWVLTGKLFEYLAAKRPVLCIGPTDGDAAKIIRETEVGETYGFLDQPGVSEYLLRQHKLYLSNELKINSTLTVNKYSRRELTRNLATLLNEISA
jgi:glycosyltransferase involved in cell wall biosynthesis